MNELRIVQVDAFADRPFTGNPAAVMPLDGWLPDETLQAIAMENNLSETAFTVPADGDADYELRWFTPTTEVVLCGHATLASAHVLIEGESIRFRTRRAGVLEVARDPGGEAYLMSLPAWKPAPKPLPRIVEALGCRAVETLWHPNRYGVVLVESEAQVLALQPDFRRLKEEGDVLTIVTAPGTDADIVSRVFATGAGIDEDPVTGSSHCCLGPYWAARLGMREMTAYQASARGGVVRVRIDGDRIALGGQAVTVFRGGLVG